MPTLSYTSSSFPFQPNTKIFSADVNQCFTDISTLLNTTKLNSVNIQTGGLATANYAALSVDAAALAANAVTTAKILDANVTSAKLASGAALANISAGSITATYLGTDSVVTAKIQDDAVTAAKITAGIVAGAIPASHTNEVTTSQTLTAGANEIIIGFCIAGASATDYSAAGFVCPQIPPSGSAFFCVPPTQAASFTSASNYTLRYVRLGNNT